MDISHIWDEIGHWFADSVKIWYTAIEHFYKHHLINWRKKWSKKNAFWVREKDRKRSTHSKTFSVFFIWFVKLNRRWTMTDELNAQTHTSESIYFPQWVGKKDRCNMLRTCSFLVSEMWAFSLFDASVAFCCSCKMGKINYLYVFVCECVNGFIFRIAEIEMCFVKGTWFVSREFVSPLI